MITFTIAFLKLMTLLMKMVMTMALNNRRVSALSYQANYNSQHPSPDDVRYKLLYNLFIRFRIQMSTGSFISPSIPRCFLTL